MNPILLLLNNSKIELHSNHSNNFFGKKISKIKNKKNKNANQLIHNYSSSFIRRKNIKSKLITYNKKFNYKRNKSNSNSASSSNSKRKNFPKSYEFFRTKKTRRKIMILNKSQTKNKSKKELSFFKKKIPSKQVLTLSHDKKINNNSFRNKNICSTKNKPKVKLKNYFLWNNLLLSGVHSSNITSLKKNGNLNNLVNLKKYSSFYKKITKKQNIHVLRFHNNKSNKSNQIKLNAIINKMQKNKNIGYFSSEKISESKNISKKSRISKRKEMNLNKLKLIKNRIKSGIMLKNGLNKQIKKIYMKTNQGNFTTRKNNNCSHENIFLNNNYNNYINFNYIDKNFNINSINITNRQSSVKPKKKISHKKMHNGKKTQRKHNNDLFDFLQLKLKANNNISTLQSKEEISISELKKMNSYMNLVPNNFSLNSISPEYNIKHIFEYKNNLVNKKGNNKINLQNQINKNNSKKSKEENNNKKKEENKRNKNDLSNKRESNKSNSNITNIYNSISISTTRDKSYYITERENLSVYIKKHFQEKGHYPKSNLNFYKYGRILGKGAFGKVNLALHIASGKLVAIKSFNKKHLLTEHSKEKIKTEIDVLKKVRKNIFCTKIYDTFQTETHTLIVMEFICADLLGFLRKRERLNEKTAKIIFKQIVLGLKYMHKLNIVHRDIKLDNLLLDLTNTIKICDFGVSKILNSPDEIMQDHCGTPAYIAPEVFKKKGYKGYSCDIWSMGVTLYYMLGGEQPFKGKNLEEMKKNIFAKNYQKIASISKEASDLLDKMLTINPDERITLEEIIQHDWLKDVDVSNRNKMKFFSKREKYLLGKYNICYLKNDTKDLIENFDKENLNTIENENKKGNTKSVILAPYNTAVIYMTDSFDLNNDIYKELKIENNICKFKGEAQVSNMQYEMSNNDEFDNGIIKTNQSNTLSNFSSLSSLSQNLKSENNEERNNNLSFDDKNKNNAETKFCEEIINEIEDKVGYDKKYLVQCLKNDEVNYATATYYLMLKDKKENAKI